MSDPNAAPNAASVSDAAQRMSRRRQTLKSQGYKLLQTHVPVEVDALLTRERDRRRVRSKGDAVAALVAELQAYRQAGLGHPEGRHPSRSQPEEGRLSD